jgi:hypothetical protein|tara:strand:+ start:1162 stop:1368 length:207 start_codon:yes stop_codon:yes gene_type:complete
MIVWMTMMDERTKKKRCGLAVNSAVDCLHNAFGLLKAEVVSPSAVGMAEEEADGESKPRQKSRKNGVL